jgi:hypothetical protein
MLCAPHHHSNVSDLGGIADCSGVENSLVEMDSRIVVNKLPPPPLKGLVKGTHACAVGLLDLSTCGGSRSVKEQLLLLLFPGVQSIMVQV